MNHAPEPAKLRPNSNRNRAGGSKLLTLVITLFWLGLGGAVFFLFNQTSSPVGSDTLPADLPEDALFPTETPSRPSQPKIATKKPVAPAETTKPKAKPAQDEPEKSPTPPPAVVRKPPSSNNRTPVIKAILHRMEKEDPFLKPYLGTDTDGIEEIVKDIQRNKESWRKKANERIEEIRKEELHLKVLQPNGRPYANEKIHIRLKKHKFQFGAAIKAPYFTELDHLHSWQRKTLSQLDWAYTLDERFKLIGQFSNQIGFANALKYRLSADNDHSYMTDVLFPRLRGMGLSIRGHTLIWPGWKHMHKKAIALEDDPEALRAFCEKQIIEYAQLWDVDEWDVMNEPRANHHVQDILGEEVMAEWFKLAKKNVRNPGAGLYVNDYKVISMDDKAWNQDNIKKYHDNVETLLKDGAPLTHLGFQSRFHSWVKPQDIYRRLDEFREYGLPMKATEFEIRDSKNFSFSEEERAQYTEQIMTTYFSHDMVCGIIAWTFFSKEGSVEAQDGIPQNFSLLYNTGIKLNGKVWLYLTRNLWHTEDTLVTNAKGVTSIRGFLGDYEILVKDGARFKKAELTLDKDKNIYIIQL
jgi:GH35 family endo-1,4-beta-xylanase